MPCVEGILHAGQPKTILVFACCLCVIINSVSFHEFSVFTIQCLHLDDKIYDHLICIVLYSSRDLIKHFAKNQKLFKVLYYGI